NYYLNFSRLNIDPKVQAKKFKAIAADAPSDIGTQQMAQAQSVHGELLAIFDKNHAPTPLGVSCGQLFCSCQGMINCELTRRACLELHENKPEYFKCLDSDKDAQGRCSLGAC